MPTYNKPLVLCNSGLVFTPETLTPNNEILVRTPTNSTLVLDCNVRITGTHTVGSTTTGGDASNNQEEGNLVDGGSSSGYTVNDTQAVQDIKTGFSANEYDVRKMVDVSIDMNDPKLEYKLVSGDSTKPFNLSIDSPYTEKPKILLNGTQLSKTDLSDGGDLVTEDQLENLSQLISTNSSNIASLNSSTSIIQSDVSTAQNDITDLRTDVTALQSSSGGGGGGGGATYGPHALLRSWVSLNIAHHETKTVPFHQFLSQDRITYSNGVFTLQEPGMYTFSCTVQFEVFNHEGFKRVWVDHSDHPHRLLGADVRPNDTVNTSTRPRYTLGGSFVATSANSTMSLKVYQNNNAFLPTTLIAGSAQDEMWMSIVRVA